MQISKQTLKKSIKESLHCQNVCQTSQIAEGKQTKAQLR